MTVIQALPWTMSIWNRTSGTNRLFRAETFPPGTNSKDTAGLLPMRFREKHWLPECLDLAWTHPSAKTEAQPIPGPYSNKFCNLAKELGIYICAGLTEKYSGKVYNSAVFINNKGDILLKFHKINLLVVEQPFYAVGELLSVVQTPFGIIGINICSDNYLDSLPLGHALARMGAQIILSPCSLTVEHSIIETDDPYKEKWLKPYSILAKCYDLVIIGTTSVGYIVGGPYEGKKMIGCSLAVNKNGVIARGPYLEFAGELIPVDVEIPERREKGTQIGEMLRKKGYRYDI